MEYDNVSAFVNMIYPQNLYDDEPQEIFRFWFEEWFDGITNCLAGMSSMGAIR